jgi:hypothetical protein
MEDEKTFKGSELTDLFPLARKIVEASALVCAKDSDVDELDCLEIGVEKAASWEDVSEDRLTAACKAVLRIMVKGKSQ